MCKALVQSLSVVKKEIVGVFGTERGRVEDSHITEVGVRLPALEKMVVKNDKIDKKNKRVMRRDVENGAIRTVE